MRRVFFSSIFLALCFDKYNEISPETPSVQAAGPFQNEAFTGMRSCSGPGFRVYLYKTRHRAPIRRNWRERAGAFGADEQERTGVELIRIVGFFINTLIMAVQVFPALDEFAEFLAKLAPRKLLEYKASPKVQERLNALLEKNKTIGLTPEEEEEMNSCMLIEHLVRLAKARALQRLNREAL